eukprot:1260015-Prymnesium_polylepis.1
MRSSPVRARLSPCAVVCFACCVRACVQAICSIQDRLEEDGIPALAKAASFAVTPIDEYFAAVSYTHLRAHETLMNL